jgi:hypothetical protein
MPAQNPCVLIATPTRGSPKMQYMESVIGTIKDLARRNIKSDFAPEDGGNLTAQRNLLANRFLSRRAFSHIFMVDDDMMFPSDVCARLLTADKPVVGTVAASRSIDFQQVTKALSKGIPLNLALLAGYSWIINCDSETASLRKVNNLGFGVVLLRRDAFELLIEKNAVRQYSLFGTSIYGFFSMRVDDVAADGPVGEDSSFYRRWRLDCGKELWALTDVPIFHIGDFAYGGRYIDAPQLL